MSLRLRFVLIACLAVVALTAAVLSIAELRSESAESREAAAVAQVDFVVDALVARAGSLDPDALARASGAPAEARAAAESLVADVGGAAAGYCRPTGEVAVVATGPGFHAWRPGATSVGHPGPTPGHPASHDHDAPGGELLPGDRATIADACRAATDARKEHRRAAFPMDVLVVAARAVRPGIVAFALLPIPVVHERAAAWSAATFVLVLATVALVTLVALAIASLRRGLGELDVALALLEGDPRATTPRPRPAELARIADGLRAMATHLADAHERERGLSERLAHEQRLAGLGRVVAGVAHEVRNPITGIKLKLDTMARRSLDERSARDVATCLQEIARLDRVVGSLLVVARRAPIEREELDLADLVDERLAQAAALGRRHDVRVRREGAARARANREALARVVDNLVRNAIEASPPGGEVRVVLEEAPGEARLTVVDRGEGVPAARRPELFEPFFTTKPEGTGLGLFLSRTLVDAHGGRLEHARADGETRFRATIPS